MEHLFSGYRTGPDIFRIVCTTSSFAFVAGFLSLSLSLSLLSQPTLICFVWVMAIPPRKPLGKSSQGCSWSLEIKSAFSLFPKLKSWLSIFLVPPAQWLSCQSICLTGRLWVRSPTKDTKTCQLHCLFVLVFYGPVNLMGSCRAWSVYLTTRLLGRISPPSG